MVVSPVRRPPGPSVISSLVTSGGCRHARSHFQHPVGQFGSGEILAVSGDSNGKLTRTDNQPFHADCLWALAFGRDGAGNGPATTLFFTAGIDHESNGISPRSHPSRTPQGNDR